ncbi:hypothetical protein P168DRAFT_186934 [Aspergillus campestris IBT 28561]|uniref:Uncharacterized protein n=1 Tax=Aspergillus campestris (strain IBT 28561) TaxID=1392248 RepID=A0A2I1CY95_ASPC2|nr:uncharacterized protein P168DRAFT_186934 [Aspergillus campestris IBT 28561]PKY02591.1 hypothetical protein P168DRAFT_186934 [Aspergillus campestris IBT 28561]
MDGEGLYDNNKNILRMRSPSHHYNYHEEKRGKKVSNCWRLFWRPGRTNESASMAPSGPYRRVGVRSRRAEVRITNCVRIMSHVRTLDIRIRAGDPCQKTPFFFIPFFHPEEAIRQSELGAIESMNAVDARIMNGRLCPAELIGRRISRIRIRAMGSERSATKRGQFMLIF